MKRSPWGIYTGSIGLLSIAGELRQNIAIRTIQAIGDKYIYNAGGGITYDSNPQEEYIECLNKAIHITESLGERLSAISSGIMERLLLKKKPKLLRFMKNAERSQRTEFKGVLKRSFSKTAKLNIYKCI